MEEKKEELTKRLDVLLEKAQIAHLKKEVSELEEQTYNKDFWTNHERARDVSKRIADIKKQLEDSELMQLLLEENELNELEKLLNQYEVQLFFSGEFDLHNAIVGIHSGQGGTEAMDWTSMLYRMYTRFFEKSGFKWEMIDMIEGEEAGIKTITMKVIGKFAYGYMKAEAGVHRLVRQSPFNASSLRQTSFALVEVIPVIQNKEININEDELEWQFFRSGGHGGQNVNKVSTAVRLKHKPSGIVVTCRTQRSQGQNRENAMKLLRAKLWEIEIEKQNKIIGELKSTQVGKGMRAEKIRTYNFSQDRLTDHRIGKSYHNLPAILGGELDKLIEDLKAGEKSNG